MVVGTWQVSVLFCKYNSSSADKRPIDAGIWPSKALTDRFSIDKLVLFAIVWGITPSSWLELKFNVVRLVNRPICGGILPVIWFPDKFSVSSNVKFPNSAGNVPVRALFGKFIEVTFPALQVTPTQPPVGTELQGVLVDFQFVLSVHEPPLDVYKRQD